MNAYTIKDLENLTGIKAHTIRIWEQRYSFLKPQRSKTNIRFYKSEELKTVLNVALLNKYGYKISHIDKMAPEEMSEKIISLSHAEAHQERLINDLLKAMVDLDMHVFERVIDSVIRSKGIDKTLHYLIFPFLDKIGILWMTSHINVAQEHLVTNVIRQKLIVGIEAAIAPHESKSLVLLFLPEGEHHEVGLLYLYYMLRSRGVRVLYLGANVPLRDLEYVVNVKKPDYIFSHLTCLPARLTMEKFLSQMHERAGEVPLIVSGAMTRSYYKKLPANAMFKKSVMEVVDFIEAIK
jgi:methanogenic corrinoid protein MtbC1